MAKHEHTERLQLMADGDNQWDLSDNDMAAIKWAIESRAELAEALRAISDFTTAESTLEGLDVHARAPLLQIKLMAEKLLRGLGI